MAIHSLSYLDINPEQRKAAADVARQRFQERLSDPSLTPEQIEVLHAALARLDLWEAGAIVEDPFAYS